MRTESEWLRTELDHVLDSTCGASPSVGGGAKVPEEVLRSETQPLALCALFRSDPATRS